MGYLEKIARSSEETARNTKQPSGRGVASEGIPMSVIRIGNTSVHEIGSHYEQHPERGYTLIVTYEGDEDSLRGEADQVRINGGQAVVYLYDPPVYRMDVRYPSTTGISIIGSG
jgi:hypothetical protein